MGQVSQTGAMKGRLIEESQTGEIVRLGLVKSDLNNERETGPNKSDWIMKVTLGKEVKLVKESQIGQRESDSARKVRL